MRLRYFLCAIALATGTAAAHATSVTYSLQGYLVTSSQGAPITLTGTTTLEILVPNPSVTSITLNFANSATQTGVGSKGYVDGHTFYVGAANDLFSFSDDLHNFTLASTLETFNVEDTSGDYVGCAATPGSSGSGICKFTGTMTQVTPEPSSIVLLGTGLLGAVGIARRRFLF